MSDLFLFLAAFAASAVEMVEALTIVLAVAVTRGWRAAGWGVAAALTALTVIVVVFGPAITQLPIDALRVVVGTILLIFGLQWLRKAILRAGGLKALHDEDAIFQAEVDDLRSNPTDTSSARLDWYGFTVAFKGVFLEGLEVAFLVVTFGGTQHNVPLAALGAAGALVVVVIVGAVVHAPLSRVPENTLKFGVGIMLTTFGTFWSAEGAGVDWPGGETAIVALLAFVALGSFALVALTRRRIATRAPRDRAGMKHLVAFGRFWYDFVVGDDWTIAVGVVAAVAVTAVAAHHGVRAWPILPLAVAGLLVWSVWRVRPPRPATWPSEPHPGGATDRGPDLDGSASDGGDAAG